MKLNCGPDYITRYNRKHAYLSNWHRFFTLIPRRITGTEQCVWFEWIERKGKFGCHYGGCSWDYEYRLKDLTS